MVIRQSINISYSMHFYLQKRLAHRRLALDIAEQYPKYLTASADGADLIYGDIRSFSDPPPSIELGMFGQEATALTNTLAVIIDFALQKFLFSIV